MSRHCWKVWRTIELGVCKTPAQYLAELEREATVVGLQSFVQNRPLVFGRIKARSIPLVRIPHVALWKQRQRYERDLVGNLRKLGLTTCPAEVGPALRLAYSDQPNPESLSIPVMISTTEGMICYEYLVENDAEGVSIGHYYRNFAEFEVPHEQSDVIVTLL